MRKNHLSGRLPITCKALGVALFVGLLTWVLADSYAQRTVGSALEDHMAENLQEKAVEYRVRFGKYISAHHQLVKVVVSSKGLYDHLADDFSAAPEAPVYHETPPDWFPSHSVLRAFVTPRFALLFDSSGNPLEVFYLGGEKPPTALTDISGRLLELSKGQSFLTTLGGTPFVLSAEEVPTKSNTLLLASPIDQGFLVMAQGAPTEGIFVALVDGETERIKTSSDEYRLPPGTRLDKLEDNYIIRLQEFYEFGGSELNFKFASLVDSGAVKRLVKTIMEKVRRNTAIITALILLALGLVMFSLSRRIANLTSKVIKFEEDTLGGRSATARSADELDILGEKFQELTEQVVRYSETIEYEATSRARRQAELERTARQLALLQSVTEALGVGVIRWTEDGPLAVNERMKLYESLAGGEIEAFGPAEGPAEDEAIITDREDNERIFTILRPPIFEDRSVVLVRETTAERRAEAERNRLTNTLSTLVDHLPEGVCLLDADRRIVLRNQVAAEHLEALGVDPDFEKPLETLDGRKLRDLTVSPPGILWHDLRAGGGGDGGRGRIFEAAARPVGRHTGTVLVLREVTEERNREEKLLFQQRLASVGQFAAGIAHDFNNILTVIIGYAELMLSDKTASERQQNISKIILESGEKAAELITQILDFSRRSPQDLSPIELSPFVKEFSKFIDRLLPDNIDLRLETGSEDYIVEADLTKLQQVLANLAVNARDAMSGEGGVITIRLGKRELLESEKPPVASMPPGRWVWLKVSDTGEGIPRAILPQIFEPFFTTKPEGKGTGLGLAQVYGIITQHGGFIEAASPPAGGAEFTIYLPEVSKETVTYVPSEKCLVPRGKGERVMVVEDEPSVRKLIERILEDLGYAVETAESAAGALSSIGAQQDRNIPPLSLVITDLVMPGQGGFELAASLRADHPSLPVIGISGYYEKNNQAEAEPDAASHFEAIINKPFTVRQVAEAVARALGSAECG